MKLYLDMKYYSKHHSDKDLVVYQVKNLPYLLARKYVTPKTSEQNKKMVGYAKNIAKLYNLLSPNQKYDLTKINKKLKLRSLYIVFYKLMFAFSKQNSSIDLSTITFDQVISNWQTITMKQRMSKPITL